MSEYDKKQTMYHDQGDFHFLLPTSQKLSKDRFKITNMHPAWLKVYI